jgi:hypothetical protein
MTRQSRSFCFSIKHLLRCVKVARAWRCCCEGPSGLFVWRTLRCSLTLGGEHVLWRVSDLTSNVLVCSGSKRRRGFALRFKTRIVQVFQHFDYNFLDCIWIKSIHKKTAPRCTWVYQWLLRSVHMIFLFQWFPTPQCNVCPYPTRSIPCRCEAV